MNQPTRQLRSSGHDGLTAFALAAGLVFGHVVGAMAEHGAASSTTLPAALLFVVAASASTLCALANQAASKNTRAIRPRIARWLLALGAGFIGALSPTLF